MYCMMQCPNKGQLPACYFSNETERTYDRSEKQFIEDNSR